MIWKNFWNIVIIASPIWLWFAKCEHNSSIEIWNQNFTGDDNLLISKEIRDILGAESTTLNCSLENSTCPLNIESDLGLQDFALGQNSSSSSVDRQQITVRKSVGPIDDGGGHVGVPSRSSGVSGTSGLMIIGVCVALVFLLIIVIFSIIYLTKTNADV